MELWFSEKFGGSRLSIQVSKYLYHGTSEYQTIDVIESPTYGKVLVLNGCVMLSEIDETAYHEMLAHVPMLCHPNPKRVLVIGGGDGGTVREILKHREVEEVHLCEIDALVVYLY